jgi:hypothetical protein
VIGKGLQGQLIDLRKGAENAKEVLVENSYFYYKP